MVRDNGNNYRNEVHLKLHRRLIEMSPERTGDIDAAIVREREAMLEIINEERTKAGRPTISIENVERVENFAAGHSDYGIKFALYCTELVDGDEVRP